MSRIRIIFYSLLILILSNFLTNCWSQVTPASKFNKLRFKHFNEEDGVIKVINCIFQDSYGFIWIGSATNGLYRYDGYEFKHFNYEYDKSNSISGPSINEFLLEDSYGNIWFSVSGTLNRYNRLTEDFTRFINNPDIPNSIPAGQVSSVAEDKQGNIWIAYHSISGYLQQRTDDVSQGTCGLVYYDVGSDILLKPHFFQDSAVKQIERCVSKVYTDSDGTVWIGTRNGTVLTYLPNGNEISGDFRLCQELAGSELFVITSEIVDIIEDRLGKIWIGTSEQGVLCYNPDYANVKHYIFGQEKVSDLNHVIHLSIDKTGNLWIEALGGLATYDLNRDTFTGYTHNPADPYSITPGPVKSVAHGEDGTCWVITGNLASTNGICRLDPETGIFLKSFYDQNDPEGLSSNTLNAVTIDRTGIVWIATLDGGVNMYDPNRKKFNLLQLSAFTDISKGKEHIYVVHEDHSGDLWIGTFGYGIFRINRLSGKIINYFSDPDEPHYKAGNTILTIYEEPQGVLWMGGFGGLLRMDIWDEETDVFSHNPNDPHSISSNHVMSITGTNQGNLLIGTINGGLNSFDPESGRFLSSKDDTELLGGHSWPEDVLSVNEDSEGNYWLGSFEGLFKYVPGIDGLRGTLIHYRRSMQSQNSISSDIVRMVTEDANGLIWIATEGGGLNSFDPSDESFRTFSVDDGLPNNTVQCILIDEKGMLWISTNKGISRINPQQWEAEYFTIEDGIQGNTYSFGCSFHTSKGEMIFGGENGIDIFKPHEIVRNPDPPAVFITDLKLYNKSVPIGENTILKKSPSLVKQLILGHEENFIAFEFAALNYTNPSRNQYRYRMIGVDADTIYSGTKRIAEYNNMSPGKYTFWVDGSNNDGVWNGSGVHLNITIRPPWWRSSLAYSIYVLMLLILIFLFLQWRTYRLRIEKQRLETMVRERTKEIEERDARILELDRMKTRFFTNISHEFRTPITLILNPVEDLIAGPEISNQELEKLRGIHKSGKRLLGLVNQLLDLSKLDSGKLKLELQETDIFKSLRQIISAFSSIAEHKGIQYSNNIPEGKFYSYVDVGKLETILNNLISNAIKFTPEGGEVKCNVEIKNNPEDLTQEIISISISDSGPGINENDLDHIFDRFYQADVNIQENAGGTGIGLSLTKELVHLAHGDINVLSSVGEGTTFLVLIPLGKEHLSESEYIFLDNEDVQELVEESVVLNEGDSDIDEAIQEQNKGRYHILVVEDNSDLREYLTEHLENEYKVSSARDGEDGIAKALKIVPDVIITDIMMPKVDGVELCKRIKTNESTSHIPVVMLTARADMESRIEGLETGADDYIIKPFNIKELMTRLSNLISKQQELRRYYSTQPELFPEKISFNSYDVSFIRRITELIEKNMSNTEFSVHDLQLKAGMSQSQLYRKLYALTGLSPSRFIRKMRISDAARMLETGEINVTQVALESGFNNLSYFTKCFREQYGIVPSDYLKQFKN